MRCDEWQKEDKAVLSDRGVGLDSIHLVAALVARCAMNDFPYAMRASWF